MSLPLLKPIRLPTQDDLPYDDGVPMETLRHGLQMNLLIDTLHPWAVKRGDTFVGGNMFLYFSAEQLRGKHFVGPDFFVVLDVPKKDRKSWVVWEEEKGPDVVIELLSDSTALTDKHEKKRIYQQTLRVGEYYWFDPYRPGDWEGFRLVNGVYEPLRLDTEERFLSDRLGLFLVRWEGTYKEEQATWIRWADLSGALLPTAQETAAAAQEAAAKAQDDAARARDDAAKARETAAAAERRARQEADRARASEAEVLRLRALLREG